MDKKTPLPVVKIQLEITRCKECPHWKIGNQWSSDGWDRMEDWVCKKSNDKIIQKSVEWHGENYIGVPDWCPIRVKN